MWSELLWLANNLPIPLGRPLVERRPEMHMEKDAPVLRFSERLTEAPLEPLRRHRNRHEACGGDSPRLWQKSGDEEPHLVELLERIAPRMFELCTNPLGQPTLRIGWNSVGTNDALRRVGLLQRPKRTSTLALATVVLADLNADAARIEVLLHVCASLAPIC